MEKQRTELGVIRRSEFSEIERRGDHGNDIKRKWEMVKEQGMEEIEKELVDLQIRITRKIGYNQRGKQMKNEERERERERELLEIIGK